MELPPDSVRSQNMQKRRVRILAQARLLLTRGGLDAINLRELARVAEVTVPTIYNLIGNKEEVLAALFSEVLAEIESRIRTGHITEPLAMAEAVVLESTAIFAADEDYYRSAFLAVEHLNQSVQHRATVAQLYNWGERLLTAGFIACEDARLLRGRIPPALLGELIMRTFRTNCRAWAFGQISIDEFRRLALTDVYITLAADAVDTFHARLTKNIAAFNAAPRSLRSQRLSRTKEHAR